MAVRFCDKVFFMTAGAQQNKRMQWAAYASIGAGLIHGVAVGLHADHASLARVFMALAFAQVAWGIIAISRLQWSVVLGGFAINGTAIVGWILTRTSGISFISGLEIAEKPQPADTLGALLAATAIGASLWAWRQRDVPVRETSHLNAVYLTSAVTLVALWSVTGHAHAHIQNIALTDSGLSVNADGVIISPSTTSTISSIDMSTSTSTVPASSSTADSIATKKKQAVAAPTTVANTTTTTINHPHALTTAQALAAASGWPRPYDPANSIDFSGIGGVTAEQAARATALIQAAQRDLPKYALTTTAITDGYVSIGDASTGFEHFVNIKLLDDGRVLDTTAPESLVYSVKGGVRTLVSAMFIANPRTPLTDTTLVNYAGGLMQWHVHDNLCWLNGKVVGVTNAAGACLIGTLQTGGAPMVHVWITPHLCGPFAALEGNGAGVANVSDAERVDLCNKDH
jgi:hypothetical protein